MAANPEAKRSQVPGSGTVSGPPPLTSQETGFFFLPLAPLTAPLAPFTFTGVQRPAGNGGGDSGMKLPPSKGSYKLSGPTPSNPGICGLLRNADSKGTAGDCMA